MKPVDQVRTGYGRGQCTEATIASLLGVELDAVPDLWAGPSVPEDAPGHLHQPLANLERLWAWLRDEHNVVIGGVRFEHARPLRAAWVEALFVMQHEAGLPALDRATWAHHHIAAGPNPDGVGHRVVCSGGKMVHDPNPARRGITACTRVLWLIPVGLVPPRLTRMPSWELLVASRP